MSRTNRPPDGGVKKARAVCLELLKEAHPALRRAPSGSNSVYLDDNIVIKMSNTTIHNRLWREISLTPLLPEGICPKVLAFGDVRINEDIWKAAIYQRETGHNLKRNLPGKNEKEVLELTKQAWEKLAALHDWKPSKEAKIILKKEHLKTINTPYTTINSLINQIELLKKENILEAKLLEDLQTWCQKGEPEREKIVVHGDCHIENYLIENNKIQTVLDFEWAHRGNLATDIFFLSHWCGKYNFQVSNMLIKETGKDKDILKRQLELWEAQFLVMYVRLDNYRETLTDSKKKKVELNIGNLLKEKTWIHAKQS